MGFLLAWMALVIVGCVYALVTKDERSRK